MNLIKKLLVFSISMGLYLTTYAQVEVARIQSKGFAATGFGAFLNFSVPITDNDAVIAEGAFYYFKQNDNNVAIAPVLLGYRHLLTGPDYGFYVEPVAGYSFGGSDIQKTNQYNAALYYNGSELDQKVTGATGGLGFGYLFEPSGPIQFNISIRYEHTFVMGDPSLNILAFRISHAFSFGRRD